MEEDYSQIESVAAEPEASMIETFRAIGYSIEAAIADIIDNSISAGAGNIWIDYNWDGSNTQISIMDDGCGMDNNELIQAMKPGSINPLEDRDDDDLGRFGLGLKTASFSQCRKFCVLTKKIDSYPVYWSWDLDFVHLVKAWKIIKQCPNLDYYKDKLQSVNSGTIVIWYDIDRLTKDTSSESELSKAKFLTTMDIVKKHLSMVFHRYIEAGLNIFFRERKIIAWDPFMIGFEGLQLKPETFLDTGKVKIKGFILPHRSKLTPEQYNYGKGPKDSWTAHQGFYVYRSKRLLVAGDWLGLFKREVHYDLCRILIDLPNSVDYSWQIDIKKSIARPPSKYKEHIISVAKEARMQALEVYRHKGKIIQRTLATNEYFPLWEERVRHGKRFYKLNRNHPVIKDFIRTNEENSSKFERILQFIEETVPIPLITLQENENEQPHGQPFEGLNHDMLIEVMKTMYNNLVSEGLSADQAKSRIASIEPFNFYLEYLEQLN